MIPTTAYDEMRTDGTHSVKNATGASPRWIGCFPRITRSTMTRTNNGSRTAKPYATFLQRRKIRKIPFGRNNRRCLRELRRIFQNVRNI